MKAAPFPCALVLATIAGASELPYPVVGSGQLTFYDNTRSIAPPKPGQPFHGQDANYAGNQPACRDNGDGTVSDLVTGLMWRQDPGDKMTWKDAIAGASQFRLSGHSDWRRPNAKELNTILDYTRSPDTTGSAAIDPISESSEIRDEAGKKDFPHYWSGTARLVGVSRMGVREV